MDITAHQWNRGWLAFIITITSCSMGYQEGSSSPLLNQRMKYYGCELHPQIELKSFGCQRVFYNSFSILAVLLAFIHLFFRVIASLSQPKGNRFRLIGFSSLLVLLAKLLNLYTFTAGNVLNYFFMTYAEFVNRFAVCCLVVQTFNSRHHAWYLILNHVLYTTGALFGFSYSIMVSFSNYSLLAMTLLISLPTIAFTLVMSCFLCCKMRFQTPARSLELQQPQKAKNILDYIYSHFNSLQVMDDLQYQIERGVYSPGRCGGLCPKRQIYLILVYFLLSQTNGNLLMRAYPGIKQAGEKTLEQYSYEWLQFFLYVQRFTFGLFALLGAWQVSRKILLIFCSIGITQTWVVLYILKQDAPSEVPLLVVLCTLVSVYQFLESWAYKSLQYVISFEMESLYGNIWLIGYIHIISNLRQIYRQYDPIFYTKTELLFFCILNGVVSKPVSVECGYIRISVQGNKIQKEINLHISVPFDKDYEGIRPRREF